MYSLSHNSPFPDVPLTNRTWPDKRITKAPRWASSDLRDGNQALVNPMTIEQKNRFFQLLLKCGFKEIEAGFPSASETEFGFIRGLIEKDELPDDVWLQVSFSSFYSSLHAHLPAAWRAQGELSSRCFRSNQS